MVSARACILKFFHYKSKTALDCLPRGCLQFVIVVFPDHTHLLFLCCHDNHRYKTIIH